MKKYGNKSSSNLSTIPIRHDEDIYSSSPLSHMPQSSNSLPLQNVNMNIFSPRNSSEKFSFRDDDDFNLQNKRKTQQCVVENGAKKSKQRIEPQLDK